MSVRQNYAKNREEKTVATYRKRGDKWRAEIRKKGHTLSSSFSTKAEAREWATAKEHEIAEGTIEKTAINKTVGEAFKRYAEEVSPQKRGARWEIVRLTTLQRTALAKVLLPNLTPQHLATYRDKRLREVKPATVNRDLHLISAVFTKARREWGWLKENPMGNVDRPRKPPARDRLISQDEIDRILMATGYREDCPIRTRMQLVGLFFLLAIETGMRLGEMCGMENASMHLARKYVQLDLTKNGDSRQVPLSTKAIPLCTQFMATDIRVTSPTASIYFRKAVQLAEIKNLHFHDTRHEAITRLARKLDVLALARMVGHRDLKSLMTYYNETATKLAEMLG